MKTQLMSNDFVAAVNDIKLAILQARARAAQASNVEALKLYFFVGGYISMKTRSAKWGTGAIHALSERLQVELPGVRGFSPSGIKRMRSFYVAWSRHLTIRPTALGEIRHLPSDELTPFYNLDMIIAVGYRVNSKRATKFRQWATGVLRDYLLKGYAVNARLAALEDKVDRRLGRQDHRIDTLEQQVDFFGFGGDKPSSE